MENPSNIPEKHEIKELRSKDFVVEPYKYIGSILVQFPDVSTSEDLELSAKRLKTRDNEFWGTASLIGGSYILTAAHCVFQPGLKSPDFGVFAKSIMFFPGQRPPHFDQEDSFGLGFTFIVDEESIKHRIFMPEEYKHSLTAQYDYAIIDLGKQTGLVESDTEGLKNEVTNSIEFFLGGCLTVQGGTDAQWWNNIGVPTEPKPSTMREQRGENISTIMWNQNDLNKNILFRTGNALLPGASGGPFMRQELLTEYTACAA